MNTCCKKLIALLVVTALPCTLLGSAKVAWASQVEHEFHDPVWIGCDRAEGMQSRRPYALFRRSFEVEDKVVKAEWIGTGLVYLNGVPVASSPARSEVTPALKPGRNILAVLIRKGRQQHVVIGRLTIEYENRLKQIIATDDRWVCKMADKSDLGDRDWLKSDDDDSQWHQVILAKTKQIQQPWSKYAPQVPMQIALWPKGRGPVDATESESVNAYLNIYRPAKPNGAAMVVCAGGGYGMNLWYGAEGVLTARWLNEHGIVAAVLQYRLPRGKPYRTLFDVQRAIRTVRSKASQWHVDPQRIGIIGYSAGGHLASMAETRFDPGDPNSADPINSFSSRPDFAILVYPVITMGSKTHAGSKRNLLGTHPTEDQIKLFSSEKQVTAQTPPTFLAHAVDDTLVPPTNSKMFYDALLAHGVEAKYLTLPGGGHGLNGYKGPSWEAWRTESIKWLQKLKLIPKDQ